MDGIVLLSTTRMFEIITTDRQEEKGNAMASGLLLCDDLLFASRILGEARARGLTMKSARTLDELFDLIHRESPSCLMLDLSFPTLDLSKLFSRLREMTNPLPRVVAYGSHIDVERLRSARAAGCDPVLPRSKFVEELPQSLPAWLSDA
jgi:CheY-like chemotaxis protein